MTQDQASFAEFFRSSWEPCLRALVVSRGEVAGAEDQLAEAFARAWTSWSKVRRHPAPRAWVLRTAFNTGATWWRRRSRELPLADHDIPTPAADGTGLDAAVMAALRRLPTRQREVVALRLLLDLDSATTAGLLGIAPGTVRAHLARAVAALRSELLENDITEVEPCPTPTK